MDPNPHTLPSRRLKPVPCATQEGAELTASIATTVDAYGHLMLEDMAAEVARLEALRK